MSKPSLRAFRGRLWRRLVAMYPSYEDYQRRTDREIPVAVLKPVGEEHQ